MHKPEEDVFLFHITQMQAGDSLAGYSQANPADPIASHQSGSPLVQGHEEDA